MRPKLIINQPGRFGDILICLPIAKWYSLKNYDVFWYCPKEYHSLFRNIDYVTPVEQALFATFSKVIDLSFGLNKETPLHKQWMSSRPIWQSFVSMKYQLAEVPISCRWALFDWKRDIDRERSLYERIRNTFDSMYSVVQESTWDCKVSLSTDYPKVLFEQIDDFNIFDWYEVLLNAGEIRCIDSCLCNFVDVLPSLHHIRKFYHVTSKVPSQEDRTILINNWRFVW